jgi:hypothetical protein
MHISMHGYESMGGYHCNDTVCRMYIHIYIHISIYLYITIQVVSIARCTSRRFVQSPVLDNPVTTIASSCWSYDDEEEKRAIRMNRDASTSFHFHVYCRDNNVISNHNDHDSNTSLSPMRFTA